MAHYHPPWQPFAAFGAGRLPRGTAALFDEVDEAEAALAHPDEPLVRDVELGVHDEGEQRERHEGVGEAATGPTERLADSLRPLCHLLVGLGGHEPGDGQGQQRELVPRGDGYSSPLIDDRLRDAPSSSPSCP
jgi:hypothetical protein